MSLGNAHSTLGDLKIKKTRYQNSWHPSNSFENPSAAEIKKNIRPTFSASGYLTYQVQLDKMITTIYTTDNCFNGPKNKPSSRKALLTNNMVYSIDHPQSDHLPYRQMAKGILFYGKTQQ